MQTFLIGSCIILLSIAVACVALGAAVYVAWRIATASHDVHGYKRGGSHAMQCVCPQCGGRGGRHEPACACAQCGGRGGRHKTPCICRSCGFSAGDHHPECLCPVCGAVG